MNVRGKGKQSYDCLIEISDDDDDDDCNKQCLCYQMFTILTVFLLDL